jgi:hypothetical protein
LSGDRGSCWARWRPPALGFVSRLLQHALPTHPRPYYDEMIQFRVPLNQEQLLNTWHSFPSDHVTVLAGLGAVLFVARSRLAIPMLIYTAVMELPRTYMGAHYPSDLIGGAVLAFMCVWAVQVRLVVAGGVRVVAWDETTVRRSTPRRFSSATRSPCCSPSSARPAVSLCTRCCSPEREAHEAIRIVRPS